MDCQPSRNKCTHCYRPQKGHPKPWGKNCKLQPIISEEEKIEAKNNERETYLEKKRKRMASHKNKEETKKRLALPKNKELNRKRMALPKNKESNRKRMASDQNRIADKKRKAAKRKNETNLERQKRLEIMKRSIFLARQRKKKAFGYQAWCNPIDTVKPEITKLMIPRMDMVCSACQALMFPFETHRKNSDGQHTFSLCCGNGNFFLPSFKDPPKLLKDLLSLDNQRSKEFRLNIRSYNSMLSMASRNISGKETDFGNSRGPPVFKISGSMFHLSPNVFPESGEDPKFAQIYVFDKEQQLDFRIKHSRNPKSINKTVLRKLQDMLEGCNLYIKQFRTAAEIFTSRPTENLRLVMKTKGSKEARKKTFMPDVSDVVVIAPGDQTERRDVILYKSRNDHPSGNDTVRIHELHQSYDPTAYILIFPHGDDGYSIPPPLKSNGRPLTAMDFYSYHLMVRNSSFNTLHRSGRLYQEYLCDMYSKVEGARLKFLKENQDKLRVELYSGLQDAVAHADDVGQNEVERIGQLIVLPASFTGSPRYMYKHYLDALAICREFRKFDLFITITCNPKWDSVQQNVFAGQKAQDRPDIMNRIFNEVVRSLLGDLRSGCFGPLKARLHTIEGQFRGLKHAHILTLLSIKLTVDDIDFIIQAQIPNEHEDPKLFEYIATFMLHGPCGPGYPNAACMEKGVCSKGFPKDFVDFTVLPNDGHGYPLYARPDNGRIIEKDGFQFDNRWIVPYNRFLLLKYGCHINVEYVGSFTTVKYIYKYVHKGVDVTTTEVRSLANERNEIAKFLNARTIDPYDATWRLFGFKVQDRFPAVQQLAIHEEDQQNIIFREGNAVQALQNVKDTTLLAFFKFNSTNEAARSIKYQDFPKFCTFSDNSWHWRKLQKNDECPRTIGRINAASPAQGERFFLRMMLTHTTGATCYKDLKQVDGIQYDTFKEACKALGLLDDDSEWDIALTEVSSHGSAKQVRSVFAVLLQFCNVTDPARLFENFKEEMSEDFVYSKIKNEHCKRANLNMKTIFNQVLIDIDDQLCEMGGSLSSFKEMPQPKEISAEERLARTFAEEYFDRNDMSDLVGKLKPHLNAGQANLCEELYQAVHGEGNKKAFIVSSPGGFGKTYAFQVLAAQVRGEGGIVLNVASTGLAAQNLVGGRTAHSRFKIPIPIHEDSTCSVKTQSDLAKLLRETKLIIWDEIFSCHRHNVEAVDRTLRDITKSDELFGGKVVCLAGDPRQTLPVVKRGGRAQIVTACIQMSPIFPKLQQFYLTENMRADAEEKEFTDYLLSLGEGKEEIFEDLGEFSINIPADYLVTTKEDLIGKVFPQLGGPSLESAEFIEGSIYTPLNVDAKDINLHCLKEIPGQSRIYLSADSILEDDHKELVPQEYLNTITVSGMADHELCLKLGCPVILLRNLQGGPNNSLRNGTRMIVLKMMDRVIECEVAVGAKKGLRVFLPRIPMHDKSNELPFTIVRRQFPIRLAFCLTINKVCLENVVPYINFQI